MTERDNFEVWASAPPREWDMTRHSNASAWPGQYVDYYAQCAWEAWRERGRQDAQMLLDEMTRLGQQMGDYDAPEID